jgi:putative serine protease PepD
MGPDTQGTPNGPDARTTAPATPDRPDVVPTPATDGEGWAGPPAPPPATGGAWFGPSAPTAAPSQPAWRPTPTGAAAPASPPRVAKAGVAIVVGAVIVASALTGAWIGGIAGGGTAATSPSATAGAVGASSGVTDPPATPAPQATPTPTASPGSSTPGPVPGGPVDPAAVAATVVPSVVYVQVLGGFGGVAGQAQAVASGSGVVLDADGHVVTNNHVVAAGSSYQVILSDGRTYPATLVGTDSATDLAVLDVDADDLTPISIGSSDALGVGDPAVAVGSPLGLEGGPSLTVGVISAIGREVQTEGTILYGMIQTDAAITEGSSGGALVDAGGGLIGITTAVGVSSVGIEGIGFATPVEIVSRVAGEIVDTGAASAPILGITGATAYADLPDGGEAPTGVEVATVSPGSPAADAGLAAGDVITDVDGTTVDTMVELVALLRRHRAGDGIAVTIDRDGTSRDLEVVLGDG